MFTKVGWGRSLRLFCYIAVLFWPKPNVIQTPHHKSAVAFEFGGFRMNSWRKVSCNHFQTSRETLGLSNCRHKRTAVICFTFITFFEDVSITLSSIAVSWCVGESTASIHIIYIYYIHIDTCCSKCEWPSKWHLFTIIFGLLWYSFMITRALPWWRGNRWSWREGTCWSTWGGVMFHSTMRCWIGNQKNQKNFWYVWIHIPKIVWHKPFTWTSDILLGKRFNNRNKHASITLHQASLKTNLYMSYMDCSPSCESSCVPACVWYTASLARGAYTTAWTSANSLQQCLKGLQAKTYRQLMTYFRTPASASNLQFPLNLKTHMLP